MGRGLVAFRKETGKGGGATPVTSVSIKYIQVAARVILVSREASWQLR